MEPIVRKGHEALDDRRLRQYMDRPDRHAAAAGGDGVLRARPRPRRAPRPARDRGAPRQAKAAARPPGRARRGGARAGPGPARGLGRGGGQRLRPPQLDLPPAARAPAGRRGRRRRDRRGGALRLPRQPGLPRQGGAHPPRPGAPPAGGERARVPPRRLGGGARAGGRGRGGARGGHRLPRPGRLRPRAAGAPRGLARPRRARALRAVPSSGARRRAWPSSGTRDLSLQPRRGGDARERGPGGPAARECSAGSWRRKDHDLPALVGALAGTRTPEVRALLEEVQKRFAGQEAGPGGGARARGATRRRPRRRPLPATRASSTPTASRPCCTGWRRARPPARSTCCRGRAAASRPRSASRTAARSPRAGRTARARPRSTSSSSGPSRATSPSTPPRLPPPAAGPSPSCRRS